MRKPTAPPIMSADALVALMRSPTPKGGSACVYLTNSGGYAIEYGRGRVHLDAIDEARSRGLIVPKWPDRHPTGYWRLA